MESAINHAIQFSKVQPEIKAHEHTHAKAEKPKIYAVVIIGLKSGERIMKDVFSQNELEAEYLGFYEMTNQDLKTGFSYFSGEYYLNGQRHIRVRAIKTDCLESISYTETGDFRI